MYYNTCLAKSSEILKCRVINEEWTALLTLDAIGAGLINFKKSGNNLSYNCSLNVAFINDGQRAVSPNVTIEFIRGACDPDLGEIEKEIFEQFTLIIEIYKENYNGKMQWLRKKQPDNCEVEKISIFDISLNTKKWREGIWGRKTASDPKVQTQKKVND